MTKAYESSMDYSGRIRHFPGLDSPAKIGITGIVRFKQAGLAEHIKRIWGHFRRESLMEVPAAGTESFQSEEIRNRAYWDISRNIR
jgi:hypothetical protein